MSNSLKKLSDLDFTSLYVAANTASKKTQSNYILIVAIDLILMVLASELAVYNYESTDSKSILYIISGFFMLISFILTIILLTRKFEDMWYQGRALAESCKTLSW